jgi:cytoskeletal protein CcmA (bactofilin family)
MPRWTTAALAVSIVAAGMLAASPASADLVTYCVGTGGPVTVPNDLYVPPGEACSLQGTTITGNVRVAAGSNLVINGGRISGEVQVAANGYLDSSNTRIDGEVNLAPGGFGVFLRKTTGSRVVVQAKGSATVEGFLFVEDSKLDGNVTSNVGEVRIDKGTEVTGNVGTSGAYYTDVNDSFVDGTLSVLNNATGSVVCGSAVQGKATFAGNLGGIQLGPNGTLDGCASGGYWARDVSVSNTTGRVTVDDNIINGQLQLSNNNPVATVAANNRIRGGVVGQQAAPGSSSAGLAAAERKSTADERAQARRSAATKTAKAAGRARL